MNHSEPERKKLLPEEIRRALRLYAVTDRRWLRDGEALSDAVNAAIKGGATMVQVREKDLPREQFLEEVREIQAVCRNYGVPCIVNDSLDTALEADADGVHLGQFDLKRELMKDGLFSSLRERLGPDRILGITAKTVEQAKAAEEAGADYIGTGAVFGSATKTDAAAMSAETFRQIAESVGIPVVAIGGIHAGNVPLLSGYGAAGIAVVSGIFAAQDPEQAARELFRLSELYFA